MITTQELQQLLAERTEPILSLYLNVNPGTDENQATTPAWQIWLKNTLRQIESELDPAQESAWETIRTRVDRYFESYRPESRTLVLFVGVDTLDDFLLPLTTENQSAFGAPLVTPFFWLLDEYERYLIALVDQEQALFYIAYLGQIGQQDSMEIDIADYDWGQKTLNPPVTRNLQGGSNREAFEDMIGEHRARFYRDVAAQIEKLYTEQNTNRIVLGGSEPTAHAIKGYLPERIANQVIAVLPIPLIAKPQEVQEKIMPVALEHERQYEAQLLDEVIDAAKSGGRGALGRADVESALQQQRVELLILPHPPDGNDWLIDLPLRASDSSATVEHVHGEALERLRAEGGVAARLYYAITPA